jgi:serine/threonine protein kinase
VTSSDSKALPGAERAPTALATGHASNPQSGPSDDLVGRVIADRYRIEAHLGAGGMATVYRAQHVRMRKVVALKVLHPQMLHLPEMVARFEREAIAAARIEHPNVASATDFGRLEQGSFFIVLEYVEGTNLQRLLREQGALCSERALTIARQIAQALGAAHSIGIVHRDLKPENVMLVSRPEQRDFVKVLDFGIAKVPLGESASVLTQMGSIFGTPEYMSPEQALGQPVDHRSDLYSLGIVLHQMLCGRPPFRADDAVGVLTQQITAQPPPLPDGVPLGTRRLVLRLLAKNAAERWQTAGEVGAEIDRLLRGSGNGTSPPDSAGQNQASQRPGSERAVSVEVWARAQLDRARRVWLAPRRFGPWRVRTLVSTVVVGGALVGGLMLVNSYLGRLEPAGVISSAGRARVRQTSLGAVSSTLGSGTELSVIAQKLAEIEALPVYQRTRVDWVTLARGHAELGHPKASVTAYRSALALQPSLARDPVVLADLRGAGQSLDAYRIVINFCEGLLGETGIDLLYQIWLDTRGLPGKEAIAENALKKSEILSLQASSALRVAIELRVTKSCEKLRSVLGRAAIHADQRAAERLVELQLRTGCGADQREDCWPCLRSDDWVAQALEQARSRPAPPLGRALDAGQ